MREKNIELQYAGIDGKWTDEESEEGGREGDVFGWIVR